MSISDRSLSKRMIRPTRLPPGPVLRMFLLAAFGIVGCVWALVRHYTKPLPPLNIAPTASAPAETTTEIPIETTE
jgi:hypothetical protein